MKSFTILKSIIPIWYFNLFPENPGSYSTCYFNSSIMKIPEEFKNFFIEDNRYETQVSRDLDLGYQAWNKGIMLKVEDIPFDKLIHKESPTLHDNYIFTRKYFKKHIVYYFLIKNIFSLHNPFSELKFFLKTRNVEKVDIINPHAEYSDYKNFFSKLLNEKPLLSIIIPTLNRYEFLGDVLADLEKQDYKNFEIIVVDQSENPKKDFYKRFQMDLILIFQNEKGQWLARNKAILRSKGNYLLFFDDDSRVDSDWVSQHVKCIDYFEADISAGVSISIAGDKIPENYSFFRWADQFDSGNALVKREVFKRIGMFDRQFDKQRMGDAEFGLRAYLAGFKSISHPYAKRNHLKVGTGGLRQMGSWDAFRPKKFFSPRPLPSVLYLYRKYFPSDYVKNALVIGILPSLIPYKWKGKRYLYPLSAMLVILIFPVLLFQIFKSWSRSSKMLKEGDKIESL